MPRTQIHFPISEDAAKQAATDAYNKVIVAANVKRDAFNTYIRARNKLESRKHMNRATFGADYVNTMVKLAQSRVDSLENDFPDFSSLYAKL